MDAVSLMLANLPLFVPAASPPCVLPVKLAVMLRRAWLAALSAVVSLCVAGDGHAQRDVKHVVRGIEARYDAARTLQATFLERYSAGPNDARVESGTVYFSWPGRMRWDYEVPEPKLFLSDGKTVWFYVPADRTVTSAKLKESADWRTPLALLTGKAKLSRLCGRVELADARVSAAGNVALRCLPRIREREASDSQQVEDAPFR